MAWRQIGRDACFPLAEFGEQSTNQAYGSIALSIEF